MKVLGIDFETFSELNISKCGSYRYMDDPHFEILLMAYAYDDEEVQVVDLANGESVPDSVIADLSNADIIKTAWNCAFEREAIRKWFGIYCQPEQWEDTMILAGQCGLPMSLGGAGKALALPEDQAKMEEGKKLIRRFCVPRKPTKTNPNTRILPSDDPESWTVFKEYNRRDVETERTIRKMLERWKPLPEEHQFWCLDARINERGVRIDRQLAEQAVRLDARYKAILTDRAVKITGLGNPKSVSQIKEWLSKQEGVDVPSLNKKEISDVVDNLKTDEAKEFMAIRSELAKSSTAKYEAMLRLIGEDDHARGCFKFYGANRTGRFAGSHIQFQNMTKNRDTGEPLDAMRTLVRQGRYDDVKAIYDGVTNPLSELVRTAIIPEPGERIVVADFSAIEARVIAAISKEEWRLEAFRKGRDIYCESASQAFQVPVEKHGVNGHLRQVGKVLELACGYGGNVGSMLAFGADKLGMGPDEMKANVRAWRKASPNIVALWTSLENAAIDTIVEKTSHVSDVGGIRFELDCGIMWMTLPSGRRIAYYKPEYRANPFKDGKMAVSYMGVNDKNKYGRIFTWGGKLAENLVQATARDCLRETMTALDREGWKIIAHVHDEVICTEPKNGRSVADMCEVFARPVPWLPNLPLIGAGYDGDYYYKD